MSKKEYSEAVIALRWDGEYSGCRTTGRYSKFEGKGSHWHAECICKRCGTKFWIRVANLRKVKSCGCLQGQTRSADGFRHAKERAKPKIAKPVVPKKQVLKHGPEAVTERYSGSIYGNWAFVKIESVISKSYMFRVRCLVCGEELVVGQAKYTHRQSKECDCTAQIERNKVHQKYGRCRSELELIWPSVMAAGRKATEKYNNAMAKF